MPRRHSNVSPARPHPRSTSRRPARAYVAVSRSGETCSPHTSVSSPVLPMTVRSRGSRCVARPRRSLAAPSRPARAGGSVLSGTGMKPKRTQTRSRLCGRVKTVTTPVALAWSRTAARSCEAISSGSFSTTTTGPCRSIAGPSRSATTAPTRRSPPSTAAAAPHDRAMSAAGQGTAAKSKSGRAIAASGRGRYPIPCQTRGTVAEARDGTGTAAGRGPPARLPVLLLAKHRVLQALREAELAHALGRNLDGLTGLRIAADARLAIREDQLAEARQEEDAALLGFLRRQRERLVEDTLDLLPGEAGLLRKVRDRCRLRHRLRHG